MIRRIIVALDPDTETLVATKYAAQIAAEAQAEVTGIAVVDTGSIAASAKGGGIGSMYLMDKVKANLTAEARETAQKLTESFRESLAAAGHAAQTRIEEGVPLERIMEDMNYQDVLVMGRTPHFFYSHPKEMRTTLREIVGNVVGPVLVVPEAHQEIERVLIAFDGSPASVRAMRGFLYLKPFGTELIVDLVNVHGRGERDGSQLVLQHARGYCEAHGFSVNALSVQGPDPSAEILAAAERLGSNLLVAGAHFVTPLSKLAFGSTTATLMARVNVPMWLES